MSQQDKQEQNNQQSVIEDLTVDEYQAAEIKAGISPTAPRWSYVISTAPHP